MIKRTLISFTALLILMSLGVTAAFANSVSFSGTFSPSDPTLAVVTITTPDCKSQGSTQDRYHAHRFTVTVTGGYNFSVASTGGGLAHMYIMDSGFNPAAALPNCIAGASNNPTQLTGVNLTAGATYYLVIFDDTFTQDTPGYSGSADGEGDIVFDSAASASANLCAYQLPLGSAVYSVPAGAPTFFAADIADKTNFDLPAGTWWISEFTGDFAKVWISCQATPFYIPANAVAH